MGGSLFTAFALNTPYYSPSKLLLHRKVSSDSISIYLIHCQSPGRDLAATCQSSQRLSSTKGPSYSLVQACLIARESSRLGSNAGLEICKCAGS